MRSLSIFSIGVFFTLAACSIDPTLADRYPVWMYAAFISSQVLVAIITNVRQSHGDQQQ